MRLCACGAAACLRSMLQKRVNGGWARDSRARQRADPFLSPSHFPRPTRGFCLADSPTGKQILSKDWHRFTDSPRARNRWPPEPERAAGAEKDKRARQPLLARLCRSGSGAGLTVALVHELFDFGKGAVALHRLNELQPL